MRIFTFDLNYNIFSTQTTFLTFTRIRYSTQIGDSTLDPYQELNSSSENIWITICYNALMLGYTFNPEMWYLACKFIWSRCLINNGTNIRLTCWVQYMLLTRLCCLKWRDQSYFISCDEINLIWSPVVQLISYDLLTDSRILWCRTSWKLQTSIRPYFALCKGIVHWRQIYTLCNHLYFPKTREI